MEHVACSLNMQMMQDIHTLVIRQALTFKVQGCSVEAWYCRG